MTAPLVTDPKAPCICLIDSPDHPATLDETTAGLTCSVVRVEVSDWGDALTPWPAAALYRGEPDYGGHAQETLCWLLQEALPAAERAAGIDPSARAIAGYSLAGLFSLYAFLHEPSFAAAGCLSGSLWYEGWMQHVQETQLPTQGRYAYFSLGKKERRASRPQLKLVQENTEACIELLSARGLATDYVLHPGGHLTGIDHRISAGLVALDAYLTR
jgi:predicted alpha/beta superfamily hydrolase